MRVAFKSQSIIKEGTTIASFHFVTNTCMEPVQDNNLDLEDYYRLLDFLRTADVTLFTKNDEDVLKQLARLVQWFGPQLSADLAYNNNTRLGFYVKKTSVSFKKQVGRIFPFENCSGHRKHVTNGIGDQKIIYSAKEAFSHLNICMYEYFFGPKKKTQASDIVYSLLLIAPSRSAPSQDETEPELLPVLPELFDSIEDDWLNEVLNEH